MRVVSDFLDRVAARVIGGDTAMLTPRILSIYEPSQAASSAPLEQSLSVAAVAVSSHVERIDTPAHAASSETSTAHAPTLVTRDGGSARVAPQAAPTAGGQVSPSSASRTGEVVKPSFEQGNVIEPLAHRVTRELQAEAPSLARAALPPVAMRDAAVADHAVGVLLPPEQPVFGASAGRMGKHASARERSRAAAAPAQGEAQESVVHVSIGRIEVRASAASASTPRRQADAAVDRLGDYLRERNKAAP